MAAESMTVAGRASTLSKHAAVGPANWPRSLVAADGSWVKDDAGRDYTDWIAGLLAVILGHGGVVNNAVRAALDRGGPTWSLGHRLEEEVAATILRLTGFEPGGAVRFVKTGSEACAAAIRVARAVTGRDIVVSCGYHGWADTCLTAAPAWGVPAAVRALTRTFRYNDLAGAQKLFYGLDPGEEWVNKEDPTVSGRQIAAVIVEPVTLESPVPGFLGGLRALCDEYGALLIFDECITGGRYPRFTAARDYGVMPDLLVLSKCLANGWPLAALVGLGWVMDAFELDFRPGWAGQDGASGPVYVSGTYSGETASLAAAKATLREWDDRDIGNHLMRYGYQLHRALADALAAAHAPQIGLRGQPYRLVLDVVVGDGGPTDWPALTMLRQELVARGQLVGAGFNLMAAHTVANIHAAADALRDAAKVTAEAMESGTVMTRLIDGHVARPPYRQQ